MKITKLSNYAGFKISKIEDYIQNVDTDLINVFNAFKGRIRLGSGINGARGENIEGEFRVFSSGTTSTVIAHTLGATPIGFLPVNCTGLSNIYMKTASATSATFVTSVSGITSTVFLLK